MGCNQSSLPEQQVSNDPLWFRTLHRESIDHISARTPATRFEMLNVPTKPYMNSTIHIKVEGRSACLQVRGDSILSSCSMLLTVDGKARGLCLKQRGGSFTVYRPHCLWLGQKGQIQREKTFWFPYALVKEKEVSLLVADNALPRKMHLLFARPNMVKLGVGLNSDASWEYVKKTWHVTIPEPGVDAGLVVFLVVLNGYIMGRRTQPILSFEDTERGAKQVNNIADAIGDLVGDDGDGGD